MYIFTNTNNWELGEVHVWKVLFSWNSNEFLIVPTSIRIRWKIGANWMMFEILTLHVCQYVCSFWISAAIKLRQKYSNSLLLSRQWKSFKAPDETPSIIQRLRLVSRAVLKITISLELLRTIMLLLYSRLFHQNGWQFPRR